MVAERVDFDLAVSLISIAQIGECRSPNTVPLLPFLVRKLVDVVAKVSIIIPIYNSEEYLEECLNSVLQQTLREIEIILVNDGSTDDSLAICDKFSARDDRIQLLSISNSGSAAARNVGLEKACGEYIGFVDSDDWIESDMFQRLYEKAKQYDVDIVSANYLRHYPNRQTKRRITLKSGLYLRKDIIRDIYPGLIGTDTLETTAPINMVTKIFRRQLIKDYQIRFDEVLLGGQDVMFTRACIINSESLYLMNEAYLYHYRYNPNSRTNRHIPDSWDKFKTGCQHLREYLERWSKYDFSCQLEFHRLAVALMAIHYELKPGNPKGIVGKYHEVKRICGDMNDSKVLTAVKFPKLSLKKRIAVRCIRRHQAEALVLLGYLSLVLTFFQGIFERSIFKARK